MHICTIHVYPQDLQGHTFRRSTMSAPSAPVWLGQINKLSQVYYHSVHTTDHEYGLISYDAQELLLVHTHHVWIQHAPCVQTHMLLTARALRVLRNVFTICPHKESMSSWWYAHVHPLQCAMHTYILYEYSACIPHALHAPFVIKGM